MVKLTIQQFGFLICAHVSGGVATEMAAKAFNVIGFIDNLPE